MVGRLLVWAIRPMDSLPKWVEGAKMTKPSSSKARKILDFLRAQMGHQIKLGNPSVLELSHKRWPRYIMLTWREELN